MPGMLRSLTTTACLLVLLSSLIAPSYAQNTNCYTDALGIQHCAYGVSYGAKAGIGAAILILICVLLSLFLFSRRRRLQRQMRVNQQTLPQYSGQAPAAAPNQPALYETSPTYNYGPAAQSWQPAPPLYEGPPQHTPDRKESFAPPQGPPPPAEDAGYRL